MAKQVTKPVLFVDCVRRMLQSKELCFDRMHLAWKIRNEKLWDASARTIASLYHIQQAKKQRHNLRRDRAVKRILRWYRDVQARTTAKQRLRWKRVKRQAQELRLRKIRVLMQRTWSGWLCCVHKEAQRRKLIAGREAAGLNKWLNAKARRYLSAYRERVARRAHLQSEIMHHLHTRVLDHIRAAIRTSSQAPSTQTAQEVSFTFLLLIRNDVWTWQVPDKQLYFLARRYTLPLDSLPLKQIHTWLIEEAPSFVDLFTPLPTQTLLVLQYLSQFFALHSRVLLQVQCARKVYEAHMLMREYLVLLYTANVVRLSPSTTFSSQQRQRAVNILQEKDRVEYLSRAQENKFEFDVQMNNRSATVERGEFTSFHCLWNHHLCKRCLAMRAERHEGSRQCKCCGHHDYESNTMARDLRSESREVAFEKDTISSAVHSTNPTRKMWASTTERCDFMVVNAFLHVLAPVNHDNRRTQSLDMLWKLAMRNAYEPVAEIYNRLPTRSLNDLLNASREELESWSKSCCPSGVDAQLHLFITIMKDEWTQVDAQLVFEAQVSATVFFQNELRPFQNGERHSAMTNNPTTSSMVKRKRSKRINQPNGRLKALVSMPLATHK